MNIPVKINRSLEEIEQKISHLEGVLTDINSDIAQLRSQDIAPTSENAASRSQTLRESIMQELRHLFDRRHHYTNFEDKDYRIRECFACKRRLTFGEFCSRNYEMSRVQLETMWNHPLIELYCCSCYDKVKDEILEEKRIEETRKIKESLIPEEREALDYIEKRIGKIIPFATDTLENHTIGFSVKDRHIIGLKLSMCYLRAVPVEIQLFSSLEILDLSINLIKKLPDELSSLSSLRTLNLSNNFSIDISDIILNMRNLQILPPKLRFKKPMVAVISELTEKFERRTPRN